MTIEEYAIQVCDGYYGEDVGDTEIDMLSAFDYDANETPEDNYDKFIQLLAQNVEVVKKGYWGLVCDFSGFFKPYNDRITEFIDNNLYRRQFAEFDEDEDYYNLVLILDKIVAGYLDEDTYGELIKVFR